MRIHQLELQALGPFAGREVIDFDALGSGIVLVNGPTGSGKSSLLDAIAYALFGDVPGARKSLRSSLRSHHAPTDRDPYVELTFSVGSQRWKILRSPEWDAPKKRVREGVNATTKRQASVVLSRWRDETWHAESTRLDEAGQIINDILGMGLAQFAQVIVLPQGEFAAFLRAKPEDRRLLLERLFDVERFDRIETWFLDRKGTSLKARSDSLTTLKNYAALVIETVTALNAPSSDDATLTTAGQTQVAFEPALLVMNTDSPDIPALEKELAQLVATLGAQCERRQAHSQALSHAAERARQASSSSTQILQAHTKWLKAQEDAQEWTPERISLLNLTIERAQEAKLVADAFARQERAAHVWQQARETAAQALRDLERTSENSPLEAGQFLASPDVDVVKERALFEQALRDKKQVDLAAHAEATAEKSFVEAEAELMRARDVLKESQRAVAHAVQAELAAQQQLDETPDTSATVRNIETLLADLSVRAPLLRQECENSQEAFVVATQAFSEAEAHTLNLRRLRLEGIAGELARGLTSGEPCLVCGSREHPAPAPLAPNTPTDEVIDAAEVAATEKNGLRLAAATHQATSEQALAGFIHDIEQQLSQIDDGVLHRLDASKLVAEAADGSDSEHPAVDVLTDARARHQNQVEERLALEVTLRAASDTHKAAELSVQRAEVALTRAETRHESATATRHQAREVHASAQQLWQETQERLATAAVLPWRENEGPLDDVVARYAQIESAQTRALRAQEMVELRHEGLKDAEKEFLAALTASPFTAIDDVSDASLNAAAIQEAQTQWRTGVQVRAQLEQTLHDPEIQAAAFTPAPDLEVMKGAIQASERHAEMAKELEAQWGSAYASVRRTQQRILEEIATFTELNTEAATMTALADAFAGSGDNERRMRLTSYVLAAHLEMVTTFANHRLTRMSGGRYQLQHTDELAARGRKSGLGLQVVDAWTGRSRDTATLSGGEAFMASLALALGLGDAVLADSGGMKLDTLFVDEGFGSLDQDTLEEVMAVLDELREGGRLVGIISHVSELRARIPTRIDVVKGPEGSHTRIPASINAEV